MPSRPIRVSPVGKYISNFATLNAGRMARSAADDIAIIDRDAKGIAITDRDGKITNRIQAKGANYALEDPLDVAFDALGHLYVLDGKSAVYVFGPRYRLVASLASTLMGIKVNAQRGDEIRADLYRKTSRVLDQVETLGITTPNNSAVPIIVGWRVIR